MAPPEQIQTHRSSSNKVCYIQQTYTTKLIVDGGSQKQNVIGVLAIQHTYTTELIVDGGSQNQNVVGVSRRDGCTAIYIYIYYILVIAL